MPLNGPPIFGMGQMPMGPNNPQMRVGPLAPGQMPPGQMPPAHMLPPGQMPPAMGMMNR